MTSNPRKGESIPLDYGNSLHSTADIPRVVQGFLFTPPLAAVGMGSKLGQGVFCQSDAALADQ